jgi:lactate 2-monooxygenase
MSARAWAYVVGGAGEGRTMRHNREAFERWRIVPRMLRGMPQRDLATSIVGTRLSSPVLLVPMGGVGGSPEQRRDHCPRSPLRPARAM